MHYTFLGNPKQKHAIDIGNVRFNTGVPVDLTDKPWIVCSVKDSRYFRREPDAVAPASAEIAPQTESALATPPSPGNATEAPTGSSTLLLSRKPGRPKKVS